LEQFGGPVSAPSANRSGSVSPTTALHVVQDYVDHDAAEDLFIIDGGSCDVGIESTVLDLTTQPPRVLRPGSITVDELAKLIGPVSSPPLHAQDASPGTQPRHYAPRIPMELVDREQLAGRLLDSSTRIAVLTCGPCEVEGANMLLKLPDDPIQYAELLYATIRHADEAEVDQLLVVRPGGDDPAWRAVLDRLERATSSQHGS
jgi:L-threonylcarbamoyladenylate synthase